MFTELPRGSDRVIGQAIEIGATSNQALFPMARRDVARALSSPRTANLPDSFSAVNNGAVRPWRSALSEERCFPAGVVGPLERAPLALDDLTLLSDDIHLASQ